MSEKVGFYFIKTRLFGPNLIYKVYVVEDKLYGANLGTQFTGAKKDATEAEYDNMESFADDAFKGKDKNNFILSSEEINKMTFEERPSKTLLLVPNYGTLTIWVGDEVKYKLIAPEAGQKAHEIKKHLQPLVKNDLGDIYQF